MAKELWELVSQGYCVFEIIGSYCRAGKDGTEYLLFWNGDKWEIR